MRVLIFSTAYLPHIGGAEVAVKEITDRLNEHAWDMITVRLNRRDLKSEKIGNINVRRLGFGLGKIDKLLFPFRAAALANRLHQDKKYDLAWSVMASFSGFAAFFFIKKKTEVKFLLNLQEGDDLESIKKKVNFPFLKNWFKEIFKRADFIQPLSNYLAEWARSMGVDCEIKIIPNAVDPEIFKIKPRELVENVIRVKCDLPPETKTVITTSRLVKKNAVDDLIKSFRYLDDNVHLIIVGDGQMRKSLENLVKKIGMEARVHFLGTVPNEEIPALLRASDVFCRPSLSEGLGISFLEAMATGTPVVATSVGGITDFLRDRETGWFCEVRNPKSIAECIEYILDEKNKEQVEKIVPNARQMIEQNYNWDKVAGDMNKVIKSLYRPYEDITRG